MLPTVVLLYAVPFGTFAWCACTSYVLTLSILARLEQVDPAQHDHVKSPFNRVPVVRGVMWVNPMRFGRFLAGPVHDHELAALILRYRNNNRLATAAFAVFMLINVALMIGVILNG